MITPPFLFSRLSSEDGAWVHFWGLDASKFDTAANFNLYFRDNYDPSNTEIVPLANIKEYITTPNGSRLNVSARINTRFICPASVFNNNTGESGSRLELIVDETGLITELKQSCFARNPLRYVYLKNLEKLAIQWNGNPFDSIIPDVMEFPNLDTLGPLYFQNYRDGNDRIDVSNATILTENPASDTVLTNYNLNGNDFAKKVMYFDVSMATIRSGQPFLTLAQAIARGLDARFVSDRTPPAPFSQGDVSLFEVSTSRLKLSINEPACVNIFDFYEIWITDLSDPNNLIKKFFAYSELSDVNEWVRGLKPATNYEVQVVAKDRFNNANPKSTKIPFTTQSSNTLFDNLTAYFHLDELGGGKIHEGVTGDLVGLVTDGTDQTSAGIVTDQLTEYGVIPYDPKFDLYQNGSNQEFVLACDVLMIEDNPNSNLTFFLCKGATTNFADRDYQFLYREVDQELQFTIFSQDGQFLAVRGAATLNLGTEYRVGVTCKNNVISVFMNGAVVASEPVPVGFEFNISSSDIIIGASEFSGNTTVYGKTRNIPFMVGQGFTTQQITDYGTPNTIVY